MVFFVGFFVSDVCCASPTLFLSMLFFVGVRLCCFGSFLFLFLLTLFLSFSVFFVVFAFVRLFCVFCLFLYLVFHFVIFFVFVGCFFVCILGFVFLAWFLFFLWLCLFCYFFLCLLSLCSVRFCSWFEVGFKNAWILCQKVCLDALIIFLIEWRHLVSLLQDQPSYYRSKQVQPKRRSRKLIRFKNACKLCQTGQPRHWLQWTAEAPASVASRNTVSKMM